MMGNRENSIRIQTNLRSEQEVYSIVVDIFDRNILSFGYQRILPSSPTLTEIEADCTFKFVFNDFWIKMKCGDYLK